MINAVVVGKVLGSGNRGHSNRKAQRYDREEKRNLRDGLSFCVLVSTIRAARRFKAVGLRSKKIAAVCASLRRGKHEL
jgi:hypothetical protein